MIAFLLAQIGKLKAGVSGILTKIGNVGATDLQTQVTALSNKIEQEFDQSSASTTEEAFENAVGALPVGNAQYLISVIKGSRYAVFVQKYQSADYASYLAISYGTSSPLYGKKAGGTWTHYSVNVTQK